VDIEAVTATVVVAGIGTADILQLVLVPEPHCRQWIERHIVAAFVEGGTGVVAVAGFWQETTKKIV